jgi:hypothetical protein
MSNPAWTRRRTAARKYQPNRIRLLLVAESPPPDEAGYFYFEDGASSDALFEELCGVLFEEKPGDRISALKELRRRGVYVTELKPDAPRAGESLSPYVMPFLLNLEPLAPERIVLVGADVYGALHPALAKAKLPVVDIPIPSPTTRDPVEFRQKLRQALVRADLERLIRPLSKTRKPL